MDLIKADVKQLYRKYLLASVTSALVMSIYTFVDTIAIGQSEGPIGAAAMAVITPFFGVLIFIATLVGIGGSVLTTNARGEGDREKGDAYFTVSLLLMGIFVIAVWAVFVLFHEPIFTFFGADSELMPKVMEYAIWIISTIPVFMTPVFISAFIRNDGAPALTMKAVIIGGCMNVFGDWLFVFPLGMGIAGAAAATLLGTSVQLAVMCSHFFTKRCTLRLVIPQRAMQAVRSILNIGIGASILEVGTIFLSIVMNNQIMRYGDTTALAVYGVIGTMCTLFQAIFRGVGQAIQPIVSANCGAGQTERIKETWRLSLGTVIVLGIVFTAIGELLPVQIVRLFIDATPEVISAAPGIIRPFFLVFLFLGITVLSTYYLQSNMHGRMSTIIAILRSIAISGLLLFVLPIFMDILGVWLAMPIAELTVAIIALFYINRTHKTSSYNSQ